MRVGTTTRFLGLLVAALAPVFVSDAKAEHVYLSRPGLILQAKLAAQRAAATQK